MDKLTTEQILRNGKARLKNKLQAIVDLDQLAGSAFRCIGEWGANSEEAAAEEKAMLEIYVKVGNIRRLIIGGDAEAD